MPNYDFKCANCDAKWTQQTTIADRDVPTTEPCPVCEHTGQIERFLSAPPGFGDPMRLGRIKAPDAFNDVLKNMKKKHLHSTIGTR